MSVKARLSFILAIIIALLIGAIGSQNMASYHNDQQAEKSSTRYLSYLLADEFRQTSMDLTRLCRTYVSTGDSKYWDAYWHIVKWRSGEVARPTHLDDALYPGETKKQSDIMAELNFSDNEFSLLSEASKNSNALIATEDQAMKSIQRGEIVAGPHQALPGETVNEFALRIVFNDDYHREVTQIMTPVNKFFQQLDERTANDLTESQEQASLWLTISLVCQIVIAVLVVILAYFILQNLTRLNHVTLAMRNIGEGDGDLTKRLADKGNDELALLARGFNAFSGNIQSIVVQLRGVIAEISSSSLQLSSTADSTEQALVQQQQGVEQIVSALEQILPAVQEVAASASQGVEQANLSNQAANDGLSVVEQVNENIGLLETDMENASQAIHQLALDTDEVGSVLDVIRGIADQTNLLALNAAIEAARAGEQGRGFAVVADEVRTLAQRTQDSTAEIQQMIEKLQSGAKNAVDVMEQSKERTTACVDNSQLAGVSLVKITEAIDAINGINQLIAAATEQQNATISDIQRNVADINQQVEQTTYGSRETAATSAKTRALTEQISQLVGQFKA